VGNYLNADNVGASFRRGLPATLPATAEARGGAWWTEWDLMTPNVGGWGPRLRTARM
jgi:hypothetical protein